MLTAEEATARLKAFARPANPPPMHLHGSGRTGRRIVSELARYLGSRSDTSVDVVSLARDLDGLGERGWRRLLEAAAPGVAGPIARWWAWSADAPYQHGWARRAFRSRDLAVTASSRLHRLGALLDECRRWPEQDVGWLAAWSSFVGGWYVALDELFASEIDAGNSEIAATLRSAMLGQHPISGTTSTGIAALLGCADPAEWTHVIDLLRAAGRQEGVRSAVLEAVDLAHPGAFARVLDVVVAEDLARFAATARAASVWFGEEIDVRTKGLPESLGFLAEIMRGDAQNEVATSCPRDVFLGLWAMALRDADAASTFARRLLTVDHGVGIRRAAARILAELGTPAARHALRAALADDDLGVYATAILAWPTDPVARDRHAELGEQQVDLLLHRVRTLGKAQSVDSGIVGSLVHTVSSAQAADVILAHRTLADVPPEALAAASADGRFGAVSILAEQPQRNRDVLFTYLTDRSRSVRDVVARALSTLPTITDDEATIVRDALRRKASDVRKTALELLQRQSPESVAASVTSLAAGTADQARAADELRAIVGLDRPTVSAEPMVRVLDRLVPKRFVPSPAERTPALRPSPPGRDWRVYHAGCRLIATSLAAWLSEHADTEVVYDNGEVGLLANVGWVPDAPPGRLPLPEILEPWWMRTAAHLTDGGVELLLLKIADPELDRGVDKGWARAAASRVLGDVDPETDLRGLVGRVVRSMVGPLRRPSWTDIELDVRSELYSDMPTHTLSGPGNSRTYPHVLTDSRTAFVRPGYLFAPASLSDEQVGRVWRLSRFLDEPLGTFDMAGETGHEFTPAETWQQVPPFPVLPQPWRLRPPDDLLGRAVAAGHATRGDLVEAFTSFDVAASYRQRSDGALRSAARRRPPWWADNAVVTEVVAEIREAAVEGEIVRGDLPGPLSAVAACLSSLYGLDTVVRLLAALGSRPFARAYAWDDSRESSLSRLVRIHLPSPDDSAERLTRALSNAGVGEKRAVEFGVYAPQWAALVEQHLGWPGFESAVWWIHAHTNDDGWSVDQEIRAEWESNVAQRTPLDSVDLTRGAVDVDWFANLIATLGQDRFARVLAAAKYASTSGGHKRAELYARALLGHLASDELVTRIRDKRHQDSVRALGLLPLTGRDDPDLLARYELLSGFVASDRTSGSARRASETSAAVIGIENLARCAGYSDPGRLTWAMEAAAVRDLAAGPITASDGTVEVTLSLDVDGVARVEVNKNGRTLKAIPAAAAKHADIAVIKERVTSLRAQSTRMRTSLERSCVTGERFAAHEVDELLAHPVIAPMLRKLVLVSDEGVVGFAGDHMGDGSAVRIAHPVDLAASGQWPELQRELFERRVTQPFRQVFRELYVPTVAELSEGPSSRRYAGQQVERRRSSALFTARGWIADYETGFGRTFHAEKLTAWCSVLYTAGTAGQAEDATLDDVVFVPTGAGRSLPIDDVPPRIFSEVMRDLDLVVSVAHAGGVDPQSSESSVEMRGHLVDETVELLGLRNVEVTGHHALIRGTLGRYSVHLGSGQVHRLPGNAVCIIPVSAQHRGRVFLPFADDDPRTAEVISKVLLLARDDEIRDPSILEQLT